MKGSEVGGTEGRGREPCGVRTAHSPASMSELSPLCLQPGILLVKPSSTSITLYLGNLGDLNSGYSLLSTGVTERIMIP